MKKEKTYPPLLDEPMSYYRDLVARAFIANLVVEAEKGVPADENHFRNLSHDYNRFLDFLQCQEAELNYLAGQSPEDD